MGKGLDKETYFQGLHLKEREGEKESGMAGEDGGISRGGSVGSFHVRGGGGGADDPGGGATCWA